ncbi:hypothetical protein OV079_01275 [Nannocystis pusilla]|uniref:Uncharacterized protein n=1 Tax=Nannocystis pusilla TaxID=889268 RepID=A0A9X3EIB2_9BACT|nr:hypothetical protein [Nannocystis pusilla]MCY1004220.1 hypothetical protein [Nannocystis pusilla]
MQRIAGAGAETGKSDDEGSSATLAGHGSSPAARAQLPTILLEKMGTYSSGFQAEARPARAFCLQRVGDLFACTRR